MRISIVTLSFNQKPFLEEAVNSVLEQQYSDLEYIVVDPGSWDGSRELLNRYKNHFASLIFEPDRGAADGLNKGFARATGDIFAFLNADDLLLPGSLRAANEFFTQRIQCDIAMGDGFILDGEGKRVRHVKARDFTVNRYLHSGARWLQQATFFRRSAFLQSPGFNIANRTCWDGELVIHMAARGARVDYMHRDIAGFRIHASSISGSNSNLVNYREDCRRIFRDITGREWGVMDEGVRAFYRIEGLLLRWVQGS